MVPESESFEFSYRAVRPDEVLKLYHGKRSIQLKKTFDFDRETPEPSGCDLFVASLICDLAESLHRQCHISDVYLEDLEATVRIKLVQPLHIVGVRGFENAKPSIVDVQIDVYCYIETDNPFELFSLAEQKAALVQLCAAGGKIKINWKPQK